MRCGLPFVHLLRLPFRFYVVLPFLLLILILILDTRFVYLSTWTQRKLPYHAPLAARENLPRLLSHEGISFPNDSQGVMNPSTDAPCDTLRFLPSPPRVPHSPNAIPPVPILPHCRYPSFVWSFIFPVLFFFSPSVSASL